MNKIINTVIIDDDNKELDYLSNYFSSSKVVNVVSIFNDGRKALDSIISNKDKIDLIIMDLLLPSVDGVSVIEELIRNNIHKDIIVTSLYKDERIIKVQCNRIFC